MCASGSNFFLFFSSTRVLVTLSLLAVLLGSVVEIPFLMCCQTQGS